MCLSPKAPGYQPPPPPAPIQSPQESQLPADATAAAQYKKKQQNAGALSANSTLLTGAAGIDPSLLNLGKTTLLGG